MSVFLETQRLYVRQFRPSDGEALAEILTDPEVTYFEPYEPFSHDFALQEAVNFSSSNEFYAVALKETDRVIGKIYFHDCGKYEKWEIGWTFHANFQGKGFARESVSAFLHEVFQRLPVRKVIAEINGRNLKSQHLAQRLGMHQEACLRKESCHYQDEQGNPLWADQMIFGLFAEELILS